MAPKKRASTDLVAPPRATSMVQVKIGNQVYDAAHVGSCHTCTHPARMQIEEQLIKGFSYRKIAARFSGVEFDVGDGTIETLPEITFQSIYNHFTNGHMPMEKEALRRLSERRAHKIGASIEDSTVRLVDQYTLAEAVVHETYDRLATGKLVPEIKDGLSAAKFLQEVEDRQAGGFDAEAWSQAMMIYFETAQAMMPPEMWSEFTRRLGANPILKALDAKLNPETEEDDDVLDAEVVHAGDARA